MATVTPPYNLQIGEEYDPVLLMAIMSGLAIGTIVAADIGAGEVGTTEIANEAITGAKIVADAIGASHIASNTISADELQTDAVIATKIKAGAVTTDKIYAGAITSDKISVNSLDAISANLGTVTAGTLTAGTVQTSANPSVSRVKMDVGGLTGYSDTLGQVFKLPTDGSAPIFASGIIQSATIIDTTIISNDFKTSDSLPWVEMTASGLGFRVSGTGGLYDDGVYDTATYGAGVTAYFGNSSYPVLSVLIEQTLADIRLYNRSGLPSGAAEIGDLAVVSGQVKFCYGAATPGNYRTLLQSTIGEDIILTTDKKLQFRDSAIGIYSQADTFLDIFADGGLRIGDSSAGAPTNYVNIKPDGEINLAGTARVVKSRWLPFNALKAPGTKPATFKEWGISGVWEFSDATDDTIVFNVQVPPDMDRGVAPLLLIGWSTSTTVTSETCTWQLEYLWTSAGEDTTANAQETLTVDSNAIAQAGGLIVAEITGIDVPSGTDACVHGRLKRLGAGGNDDLTDTAELHGVCFKYTSNKLGTAT